MTTPSFDQSALSPRVQQGIAASMENDAENAVHFFSLAIAERPEDGLAHFLLASEYASLGEMEKAENEFAAAVLLAPAFTIARYQLGLLQFSSGRASMAMLTWQPLFDGDERDPLRHFVHGFAALAQDAFDEAIAHFETGLPLNTTNPPLSQDILKVIQRLNEVRAMSELPVPAEPATPVVAEEEMAVEAHVLLNNYRQQ